MAPNPAKPKECPKILRFFLLLLPSSLKLKIKFTDIESLMLRE